MRRSIGTFLFLNACSLVLARPVFAAHDPLGISLGLSPKGTSESLRLAIEKQLELSKRFSIRKAVPPPPKLYPWPENEWRSLQRQTDARLALIGTVRSSQNQIDVDCRLIDLKLGAETKALTYSGNDLEGIAKSIVRFLRVQYPLQAHVTPVKDDLVILDVGSQDGVKAGDVFVIWRFPEFRQEGIANLKVSKTEAWYSEAKIVEPPTKSELRPSFSQGHFIESPVKVELKLSDEGRLSARRKLEPINLGDLAIENQADILTGNP